MRIAFFTALVLFLGLAALSSAYSSYSRQEAFSSSSSSSTAGGQGCCTLSPWANDHMNEIRQLAKRLRQEYSSLSRGSTVSSRINGNPMWSADLIDLSGKTHSELDALSRQISEKLISEQRSGRLPYAQIVQPNFFEYQASEALENLYEDGGNFNQQQQQQLQIEDDFNTNGNDMLSKFDEVSHYSYPSEVKVINGQTYVTQKNCTTATTRDGNPNGPSYSVLRVNRTHTTTNSGPMYIPSSSGLSSSSLVQQQENSYSRHSSSSGSYVSPMTASSNLHHIYGHMSRDEVGVPNYSPQVTLDDSFLAKFNSYRPPIVIPVETTGNQHLEEADNRDIEKEFRPSHTVTVHKYNRTIITGPDGKPIVSGSESKSVWDNGELVYNFQRPFGNLTLTKDEEWQQEERERLFWLFQQPTVTEHELKEWQRQQEERLMGLAYRYNTTIDTISNWQQHELSRFKALVGHYNTFASDLTDWQQRERARIDWLIHQNSLTRDELNRWQRENQDKLNALSHQYHISMEELKQFQKEELDRLYLLVNQQNNINNNNYNNKPMASNLYQWQTDESNRLHNLLAHHNSTVDQLQESIRRDQERLKQLSNQYHVNVGEMEKWLKSELSRLSGIITQQQEEMKRISDWQQSERNRLQEIVQHHNLTVEELEDQMKRDRAYMQSLAQKYHVSIEDLEKWQHTELERLHEQGRQNLEKELKEWQQRERERLMSIIKQNDLTIEDFQTKIQNDRTRLQQLSVQYKVQVEEIEDWLRKELQRMQSEGLLKQVEKELTDWQQKERDRLLAIVQQNELTIDELEKKIKTDQAHLYGLSGKYEVRVEEIEEWLQKELQRLQNEGLLKVENLKEWQKLEREKLLKIVQENQLTIEEFEKRLIADKVRLQKLAQQYHIEMADIELWLRKESERLQNLGLIKAQEQLNEWQKIERDRLQELIHKNELSVEELKRKLESDQVHLHSLAYQYHVRVEEIEEFLKQEIQRLQNQGLIQMGRLEDWQRNEREKLQQLVEQRDYSMEEFHKWLENDRQRLQNLALQHHMSFEEIIEWERNEGERLEALGLIKPQERLTDWQQKESNYLQQLARQQQFSSTQELETRLRQDREHLANLARQYHIQVEEIENFLHKELQRLRDQGQLQIDNLTAWQLIERDRLQDLIAQNNDLTVLEFEEQLKKDREHLKQLAFEYHTSVEQVEEWLRSEVERLRNLGQLKINEVTVWQAHEREYIKNLIKQRGDLSLAEFEEQLRRDRERLQKIANDYHVSVEEIENWMRNELFKLKNQTPNVWQKEEDNNYNYNYNFNDWQQEERLRLRTISAEIRISEEELVEFLANDQNYQRQLARNYSIPLDTLIEFQHNELRIMNNERLLDQTKLNHLEGWQKRERDRIYALVKSQNFNSPKLREWQKQDTYLNTLARQYYISVGTLRNWQLGEMERLEQLAKYYKMNLNQLEDFRSKELRTIQVTAHKKTMTDAERITWASRESARFDILSKKTNLSGEALIEWRRRLYLLCQGLINQDFGEQYGGQELSTITGVSGSSRNHIISQDRGDQPPQVYEEEFEETEPGLPGAYNPNEPGLATDGDNNSRRPMYFSQSPPRYTNEPLPSIPAPSATGGGTVYTRGHVYRKKEYSITSPVGTQTQTQQYNQQYRQQQQQHNHRHGHGNDHFGGMESGSLTRDVQAQEDFGQQIQQEEGTVTSWTGHSSDLQTHGRIGSQVDFGQQVQKEDLSWVRAEPSSRLQTSSSSGSYSSSANLRGTIGNSQTGYQSSAGQQQVEIFDQQQIQPENFGQQIGGMSHTSYSSSSSSSFSGSQHSVDGNQQDAVVVQAEPIEEQPGFWGKLRNKAKNLFSG